MNLYRPPRSEHVERYLRFVLDRRKLEAARARVWWWERAARWARLLTFAWVVVAAAELLRGGMGPTDYFTVAALGFLAVSEWVKTYRKARQARRIVARRAARLK